LAEPQSRGSVKRRLGLEGRTIISTVGLLDRRKGIDYAIAAMHQVVERHPDVLYLVVGETHPEVRKRQGEQYRNELSALVQELGLTEHVRFVNQYVSERELVGYLQASDIYLTPYLDRNQITSGTLAFAVGVGKAVISTPYLHATEALDRTMRAAHAG
jgi:glycosyltransferase involved in cell wall biosynthesis